MLLGRLFIDLSIREIFRAGTSMVPLDSDPVPILTSQFIKSDLPLLHLEPSNIGCTSYNVILLTTEQVIIQSYIKTPVNATAPVSALYLLGPAQLNQQYSHVVIAPGILDTSKECTFIISCFGSTMHYIFP